MYFIKNKNIYLQNITHTTYLLGNYNFRSIENGTWNYVNISNE
jgi:hypothetical protein